MYNVLFNLTKLNEILDLIGQGPSLSPQRTPGTSDPRGEKSDNRRSIRQDSSKKTFRRKKSYGVDVFGNFFVTVQTDVANQPNHLYCRICKKNFSVLNHSHYEILRHSQENRNFPIHQKLRFETAGWKILDFEGEPKTEEELQQQKDKIRRGPLFVWDREHPFTEDLIIDEAWKFDPNLSPLRKVTSPMQVLQFGGSSTLVEKMWLQFVLTASNINLENAYNRDEVLVSSVKLPESCCVFPGFHCGFAFSQSSRSECCHGFYFVQSSGQRLSNSIVWRSMSAVFPCGHFSGFGTDTISVVWQLVCQILSKTMLPVNFLSVDLWLLLMIALRLRYPCPGISYSH